MERVNGRAKVFWGVDDGNVTGARRFHAYAGAVMVVCLAFATLLAATARRDGSMGHTRLGPIALALREAALDGEAPQAGAQGPARPSGQAPAAEPAGAAPDTS